MPYTNFTGNTSYSLDGLSPKAINPIVAQRSPVTTDLGYPIGQTWINTVTNQAWTMTGAAAGVAVWALSSPGASDVDTINGLSPVAGNIVIAGGTNLTDVNGGNTITLNLDPAITLATSVTSPLYTAAAATPVTVTAPAGQNIVLKMGDAAGANKVSFQTNAAAEVFAVDSTGAMTFAALTVAGNFAQTAGTFNVGQDNAANAINIGGGTTARAIGIGNSAAPHVLTLGSSNTTAQTILQSGTVGLSQTSTGPLTIDSAGVLELNSSAGVIGIGNDAVAQNINVGTGAAARTITVGNISGATAVNINTGTGGSAITTTNGTFALATGTGAINIGADAAAHTITLGNSTGATSVVVNCGTGALDIGTNAIAHTVTIGNITGATAVNVNSGTGACAWTTTNGTFGLVTGTGAINLGTDAVAKTITLGNITGATALNINTGTGGSTYTTTNGALSFVTGTGAINVGADAAAKTITVGNATGATSVVVNGGTGAMQFGANAIAHTTTVGTTTGAAATVLQAGTGKFTMTGTVRELTANYVTRDGVELSFLANPVMSTALNTGGAPTGVTGDVNLMAVREGIIMEQFILGAGQTIIAPRMDTNGLLVSLDLTVAEGAEYNFGAGRTNSPLAFTIGTSPAFMFELRFRINDMDGAAPYIFGFRKSEANNATFANYTDYVGIGMNAGTSATNIVIYDELNSGGQTITNTTDLWGGDGTTNTLTVLVSAAGVVTYLINGLAPTATHAFTFDNGDVVCPYIRIEHSATPTQVNLVSMKIGSQI